MTDFPALSGRWLLLSRPSGHAPEETLPAPACNGEIVWRAVVGRALSAELAMNDAVPANIPPEAQGQELVDRL